MVAGDKEQPMFSEGHDNRTVQRGITEALACQDMLERAPVKPSWVRQVVIRAIATAQSIARHESAPESQIPAAGPPVTR
jgi:hypothetical protein